jgi:AcrR family transcriptional regulator
MFKTLYWGNPHTVLSTLLLGAYLLWACAKKVYIQRWGWSILLLILLHGVFWYFANIRDGYSNSIVHAIDGSTEMGLFSANSAQSIVFWIASIAIWLLGSLAIFKPQVRKPVFFIMAALSVFSMGFIEASRIWPRQFVLHCCERGSLMAKRNTKELILLEALKLFADKGYEGVSVRDIAAEVGIRQSSLYKHFESKQDIFDTLVETMKNRFPQASASFQLPDGTIQEVAKEYATCGTEFLKKTSAEIFRFYLKDPYASQFRKMLSIEKYRSPEIDRIYREIYMERAISYQAALFEEMMAQGLMRQADASIMALQFFAPIFLLLNQYDGILEKESEALETLGRHIEQFDQIYRKGVEQ